ncbi:MAG: methylase involved in ubiquinone/menaquinone biosynthesis [Bryobacterales bacterium]|nr:methylase involved in ubiquinone/menaquinone biosynthesis [Bryobacterales bacterium]
MRPEAAIETLINPFKPVVRVLVPLEMRWYFQHQLAKQRFHDYIRKKVGPQWFRDCEPGPAMTRQIRLMTKTLDEHALEAPYADNKFFYEAYHQMHHLLRFLEPWSFNLRTMGSVLEFGCGSARLLRLLRCIEEVRLVGTDANPTCVEWCQSNVPGPEFYQNELTPPLSWARDNEFDLIFASSVFTHIPLDLQTNWLKELYRISRPGAIFICTVHGKLFHEIQLGPHAREQMRKVRDFTLTAKDPNASLSTRAIGSWDVHQTRERMIEIFGSVFQLLDFIPDVESPNGQDVLILKRPR